MSDFKIRWWAGRGYYIERDGRRVSPFYPTQSEAEKTIQFAKERRAENQQKTKK